MSTLHDDLILIDGLIISRFGRAVFEDMRRGGLTAANCTCSVWEGFEATMSNIADWKRMLEDNGDLILPVRTVADIRRAKEAGRTGIILGFQNTSAFGDDLGSIALFKELGVGIVQMTYNTQNLVGSGCYESRDGGLSDFGREVVAEMNRVGILCDLSHVGANTSRDVILVSQKPVAYTHCLPSGLKQHPRNKSDEELRFIIDHGGFVGVTMFPPFLPKGPESTVDDYVAAIDYVINLVGDDRVGIGTDFTQGQDRAFFDYLNHDKGRWRPLVEFGSVINPEGIRTIGEYPNLTRAMERAGWPEGKIRKVLGENWLQLLGEVWGIESGRLGDGGSLLAPP
jgi:membrane dipeptidase